MPFAELNDHKLYYEDTGGSGPVLLFSHGFVLDRTMWAPQIAASSENFRCVSWDERGHGMSDCTGDFDFWDLASDSIGLLDQLEIDSATLIGMSQGGFLSMRAALSAPQRVSALIIVDSAVQVFTDDERQAYGEMARAWTTLGPVGEIAQTMGGLQFGSDYDWSQWLGKWQYKPPVEWTHTWQSQLNRDDITSRLPEIACPVGFVHGVDDHAFPLSHAHEMSEAVPNSLGVRPIAGGAHACVLTHPDEVTAAILALLEKVIDADSDALPTLPTVSTH